VRGCAPCATCACAADNQIEHSALLRSHSNTSSCTCTCTCTCEVAKQTHTHTCLSRLLLKGTATVAAAGTDAAPAGRQPASRAHSAASCGSCQRHLRTQRPQCRTGARGVLLHRAWACRHGALCVFGAPNGVPAAACSAPVAPTSAAPAPEPHLTLTPVCGTRSQLLLARACRRPAQPRTHLPAGVTRCGAAGRHWCATAAAAPWCPCARVCARACVRARVWLPQQRQSPLSPRRQTPTRASRRQQAPAQTGTPADAAEARRANAPASRCRQVHAAAAM
jgi:hypothetical protein